LQKNLIPSLVYRYKLVQDKWDIEMSPGNSGHELPIVDYLSRGYSEDPPRLEMG
jgi:hypothetical protein